MSSLRIEGLSKRFGGVTAVDSFTARVDPGEIVALVGPNGAGKSTLLQLVSGLLAPDEGAVWLGQDRLTGRSPEHIASLGVARAFQTSRVFPMLSVWDSVRVGGIPSLIGGGRHGRRMPGVTELVSALVGGRQLRERIAELDRRTEVVLSHFGDRLLPRREDTAQSLSYANRRRLELARTLVSQPLLLLLDEPTAGMNPTETEELADLVRELHSHQQSLAILLVEHKMNVVRRLADRTIVMDHGQIIAEGPPHDVLENERVIEAYLGRGPVRAAAAREAVEEAEAEARIGEATGSEGLRLRAPGPRPGAGEPDPETAGHRSGSTGDRAGDAGHDADRLAEQGRGNTDTTSDEAQPLVELKAIDVYYGAVQALAGVSLTVRPGELVAILGGNASGKSTTVKSVLGVVRPARGEIRIDGERTDGLSPPDIIARGLASVPEGRRVFSRMSVYENLLMGAFVRRRGGMRMLRGQIDEVLEMFPRLRERLSQSAGTLSGGEQQMLAMGRAMLRRPRLLCIDEPSMGLSPIFVDSVYDRLRALKESGLTILMVDQNANRALELADRAYVLRSGEVMLSGHAAELRNDPMVRRVYLGG